MSKVEDSSEYEEYGQLNIVQQWVLLFDDQFGVKYCYKFYQELDYLLNRYDQNMISFS
jgi:hypothetical protein